MVRTKRLLVAALALLAVAVFAGCQEVTPSVGLLRFTTLDETQTVEFTSVDSPIAANGGIIEGAGAAQYEIKTQTCVRGTNNPLRKGETCSITIRYVRVGRFRANLNVRNERDLKLERWITLE